MNHENNYQPTYVTKLFSKARITNGNKVVKTTYSTKSGRTFKVLINYDVNVCNTVSVYFRGT